MQDYRAKSCGIIQHTDAVRLFAQYNRPRLSWPVLPWIIFWNDRLITTTSTWMFFHSTYIKDYLNWQLNMFVHAGTYCTVRPSPALNMMSSSTLPLPFSLQNWSISLIMANPVGQEKGMLESPWEKSERYDKTAAHFLLSSSRLRKYICTQRYSASTISYWALKIPFSHMHCAIKHL